MPPRAKKKRSYKIQKVKFGFLKNFNKQKFLTFFLVVGIVGVVLLFLISLSVFAYYAKKLPSPDTLTNRDIDESTKIYDRKGKLLYEVFGEEDRTLVTLKKVSPNLINAVLATEDGYFYKHDGFDVKGFIRGLVSCVIKSSCQGGSTLTQQLSKNALLSSERTVIRKIKELILSLQIEKKYSKDDILQMYLNEAPFGHQAYGIESAANLYFNKSADNLTLAQAALLAGLPQQPSTYSPCNSPENAKGRQLTVIRLMEKNGWYDSSKQKIHITKEEAEVARNEELKFNCKFSNIKAPHFVMYIKKILEDKYGAELVEKGGLKVTTSLDYDLQQEAEKVVKDSIETSGADYSVGNGALVAIKPGTGEILAMVGSKDYFNEEDGGQFNVATAKRQPGSSIKPVTYITALSRGYTAGDIFFDVKTKFPGGDGQPDYEPENYDLKYQGPIFMRDALGNSINTVAVQLLSLVGIDSMIQTANKLGIKSLDSSASYYGLSLTLGSGEVTLLELTNAYATFANNGVYMTPVSILKVENSSGKVIEQWKQSKGTRAVKEEEAYILTNMLSDNNARLRAFGPYSYLTFPNNTVAVKTGTTNDVRDNWTIGYTPSIAIGVWVGNNDNSPMSVKSGVAGAAPIFNKVMTEYLKGKSAEKFERPDNVIEKEIDKQLGGLPQGDRSRKTEVFIKGTEPNSNSKYLVELEICKEDDKLASDACKKADKTETRTFFNFVPLRPEWQEVVNDWIKDNISDGDKDKYNPPTEVSDVYFDGDGNVKNDSEPEIVFNSPHNDDSVSNKFTVEVDVLTPNTVTSVAFYLDGVQIGSDDTSIPYSKEINISSGSTGDKYKVSVVAVDSAGNEGSGDIQVKLK